MAAADIEQEAERRGGFYIPRVLAWIIGITVSVATTVLSVGVIPYAASIRSELVELRISGAKSAEQLFALKEAVGKISGDLAKVGIENARKIDDLRTEMQKNAREISALKATIERDRNK